jgi:hypothetical protein
MPKLTARQEREREQLLRDRAEEIAHARRLLEEEQVVPHQPPGSAIAAAFTSRPTLPGDLPVVHGGVLERLDDGEDNERPVQIRERDLQGERAIDHYRMRMIERGAIVPGTQREIEALRRIEELREIEAERLADTPEDRRRRSRRYWSKRYGVRISRAPVFR